MSSDHTAGAPDRRTPIPIRRVVLVLAVVTIVIFALHTAVVVTNYFLPEGPLSSPAVIDLFTVSSEANIPTWYSTILLFLGALAAGAVRWTLGKRGEGSRLTRAFWLILALGFCFLSLDEGGRVHEIIDRLTYIKWTSVYAPFAAVFFLFCLYYALVAPKTERRPLGWIVGGLVVYGAGGLGAEYVFQKLMLRGVALEIEYVLEEGFEILGAIMVLGGCLLAWNALLQRLGESSGERSGDAAAAAPPDGPA